jgi:hypothetical protein
MTRPKRRRGISVFNFTSTMTARLAFRQIAHAKGAAREGIGIESGGEPARVLGGIALDAGQCLLQGAPLIVPARWRASGLPDDL